VEIELVDLEEMPPCCNQLKAEFEFRVNNTKDRLGGRIYLPRSLGKYEEQMNEDGILGE
jgi:hypothetical protein